MRRPNTANGIDGYRVYVHHSRPYSNYGETEVEAFVGDDSVYDNSSSTIYRKNIDLDRSFSFFSLGLTADGYLILIITNALASEYYAVRNDKPVWAGYYNYSSLVGTLYGLQFADAINGGYGISVNVDGGTYIDTRYGNRPLVTDVAIPGEVVTISFIGNNSAHIYSLNASCEYVQLTPSSIAFVMPNADVSIDVVFAPSEYEIAPITVTVTYLDPETDKQFQTYFNVAVVLEKELATVENGAVNTEQIAVIEEA